MFVTWVILSANHYALLIQTVCITQYIISFGIRISYTQICYLCFILNFDSPTVFKWMGSIISLNISMKLSRWSLNHRPNVTTQMWGSNKLWLHSLQAMNVDTHFSFPDQFWCECVVYSNRLCHFEYIDHLLDVVMMSPYTGSVSVWQTSSFCMSEAEHCILILLFLIFFEKNVL